MGGDDRHPAIGMAHDDMASFLTNLPESDFFQGLDRFLRRKRFHEKIVLSAARLIGHFDLLNPDEMEFFRHRLLDFQIQFDRFLHPF